MICRKKQPTNQPTNLEESLWRIGRLAELLPRSKRVRTTVMLFNSLLDEYPRKTLDPHSYRLNSICCASTSMALTVNNPRRLMCHDKSNSTYSSILYKSCVFFSLLKFSLSTLISLLIYFWSTLKTWVLGLIVLIQFKRSGLFCNLSCKAKRVGNPCDKTSLPRIEDFSQFQEKSNFVKPEVFLIVWHAPMIMKSGLIVFK